jgi:hypothetical protein
MLESRTNGFTSVKICLVCQMLTESGVSRRAHLSTEPDSLATLLGTTQLDIWNLSTDLTKVITLKLLWQVQRWMYLINKWWEYFILREIPDSRKALDLCSEGTQFGSRSGYRLHWLRHLPGFPQTIQVNPGIVPWSKRSRPSKPYLLIIHDHLPVLSTI